MGVCMESEEINNTASQKRMNHRHSQAQTLSEASIYSILYFSLNSCFELFSLNLVPEKMIAFLHKSSSSSSRLSDGNSSLPDEGGSASQVPQASVQLAGYRSVVWPHSLSEWLVGGAGLQ